MDLTLNNININKNKPLFKGDRLKLMSKDEKMLKLIDASIKYLNGTLEREMPENGKFAKVFVSFDIPNTNNEAILFAKYDEEEPVSKRRLILGVRHKNRDRLASAQLICGSKNDILEYLSNSQNKSEIKSLLENLSKNTDDYYSSF